MKLLILGGTQFVGRGVAEAAIDAGHEVTLFHRGRTGPGVFPESEHVLGDRDGGLTSLEGRAFDACVDVSGYLPRLVRASAELLRDVVARYVFVSSISAYASLAEPVDETAPLAALADESVETIDGGSYGGLKALCERTVSEVYAERSTVLRPTFVVGPHDHTGRFTWWVHRGSRGGDVLIPATGAWRMQFIDVRDLGRFTVLAATTDGLAGAYNVVGPRVEVGLVDVVEEAAELAGASVRPVVVDDAFLVEHGVRDAELPLWAAGPEWRASAEVDGERALAAGLVHTPVVETIHATLDQAATVEGVGLTREREAELLAGWAGRD